MNRSIMRISVLWMLLLSACRTDRSYGESRPWTVTPEPPAEPSDLAAARISSVIIEGLSAPEAVVHDVKSDVYLISNVNGPAARRTTMASSRGCLLRA